MTDPSFKHYPPGKEDELHKELKSIMSKGGPNAVSARLMEEISPALFKIIDEELKNDMTNCMIGLLAFYTDINSNVILQTPLISEPEEFCELVKSTFGYLLDRSVPVILNEAGKQKK